MKLPLVEPEGTVIDAGTVARVVLLEVSVTTCPLAPAALLSVTVPETVFPPITEEETKVTPVG